LVWDVNDPLGTRFCPTCITTPKFRRSRSNCLGVSGGPKIWGTLGPAPFGWGRGLPPRNMRLQHLCYRAKYGHSGSNRSSVITGICPKNLIPHAPPLRSLEVIGVDTDRSATYDFLLVFHSNYGPLSYRFQYKWRYLQEINPTTLHLTPPLRRSPLEFCVVCGVRKI